MNQTLQIGMLYLNVVTKLHYLWKGNSVTGAGMTFTDAAGIARHLLSEGNGWDA